MKAHRHTSNDRHRDHRTSWEPDMNQSDNTDGSYSTELHTDFDDNDPPSPATAALEVDMGNALPPANPGAVPVLGQQHMTAAPVESVVDSSAHSMVADGLHFVGNAVLRGPCSIAGQVVGNITPAPQALVSVVVTETGRIKGDVTAHKISVMGHTEGVLDSGQGDVVLFETASVHGLVRYGRIQVNGADLNATLERVSTGPAGV